MTETSSTASYGANAGYITITSPCSACGLDHKEELEAKLDDGAMYVDCPTNDTKIWIVYA